MKGDKEKGAKPEVTEPEVVDEVDIDLGQLRQEVGDIVRQKDEYFRMLQQATADFENFKKRNATSRADAMIEARTETVLRFLPVLDNLERAVAAAAEADRGGALLTGVDMVVKQFEKVLQEMDVVVLSSSPGEVFDPHVHNAVMTVPSDAEHPDNTIFDTLQKGYKVGERVARYAQVRVAKDE